MRFKFNLFPMDKEIDKLYLIIDFPDSNVAVIFSNK